jgi:NADPH-dependent glutamate synthase beta subunit-like oxidoreductase
MVNFDQLEKGFSEEQARAEARHKVVTFHFATSVKRIHGDVVHQPQTVILAMREGRRGAVASDALLQRG